MTCRHHNDNNNDNNNDDNDDESNAVYVTTVTNVTIYRVSGYREGEGGIIIPNSSVT